MIFIDSCVKQGDYEEKGWPDFEPVGEYCYSKVGLTLASFAQQRELDKDAREDLVLNVVSRNIMRAPNEKTCLRSFRPGPTQTGLYSHRRKLED